MASRVRILNYRELNRAFSRYEKGLGRELRAGMRRVAGIAAREIKAAVPYGPAEGGHWRSDIRPGSTRRGAYVTWGRAKRVYAPWMEFGGNRRTRSGNTDSTRPYIKGGRFVYPTVDRLQPVLRREADKVLDRLGRRFN